jgi:hypothetical protein
MPGCKCLEAMMHVALRAANAKIEILLFCGILPDAHPD